LVCITHVPDTTSKILFTDDNKQLIKDGVQFIIGPYDDFTLARAVEIKEQSGAELTVINVGNSDSDPTLRKALAIGADKAVRINSDPTDSLFVAKQIANYANDKAFDMVLMGRESIDYNGGVVHSMVGEILGLPSLSPVMRLEIDGDAAVVEKEIDGGKQVIKVSMPFVAGCQEPIAEWKIPNMRGIMSARSKPLEVLEPFFSECGPGLVSHDLPPEKAGCKMISADHVDELIGLLKNEAKVF
jgi:electron transfer flavoprotein beta subunit